MNKSTSFLFYSFFLLPINVAFANEVEIKEVRVICENTCTFNVTLEHADTGWEHYADGWEVLDQQEKVIAKRTLYHPHVNEQPFTRSLNNVEIAEGTKWVWLRAHDSVHGYSELEKVVLEP